jgi:DMSO/TMAO reductase YedYZ molybdopterin-dependent catalytic subunit
MPEESQGPDDGSFERRVRERYGLEPVGSDNSTLAAGPADRGPYEAPITPIEDCFVLNHHPTPEIDADDWTVSLTGAVDESAELTVTEIAEEYPTVTVTHTMECAGNGRAHFEAVGDEPTRYVQWDDKAVATARWTGTPLSAVLDDHDADGAWVAAIGGDAPDDPEADVFARSLPMAKVRRDCILAYRMNGESLPADHGFPVRVIAPGWYGANSVKWLDELRVMDGMMTGAEWERYTRWQQDQYRLKPTGDAEPTEHDDLEAFGVADQLAAGVEEPYTYDQSVMSLIAYPDDGDVVSPGPDGRVEVVGVAWAGDDRVEDVAVSTDGGGTWYEGSFMAPAANGVWRPFRCALDLSAGEHRLVSRATDERGRRQPARVAAPGDRVATGEDEAPWNREGYCNNAYDSFGVEFVVEE